ncbi:hypothetical protein [Cellulomonas citrea]|uniref:hypothetical protein n=1 Tax=Cellulomonas citrea TaxID=1909423 RepID=UPI00135B530B|nr:hypothetical protein [Cellulomonas citrea]
MTINASNLQGIVALVTLVVTILGLLITQAWTAAKYQRSLTDRNLDHRISAYADLLTTQDSRFSEYDRARRILGPAIDRADPDSPEVDECRKRIDRARGAAWDAQARLQILAPQEVLEAATSYADEITAANPLRLLRGGKARKEYIGLANDRKGRLKDAFVDAARRDLESDKRRTKPWHRHRR